MKQYLFGTFLLISFLSVVQAADDIYRKFPVKALEKTAQDPISVGRTPSGSLLADFGRDAFGQIRIRFHADTTTKVVVRLGECLKDGCVDMEPGGTIRACEYEIGLKPGLHDYDIVFRPDARNASKKPTNAGTVPILMPEEIGEVYPFRYVEVIGDNSSFSGPDSALPCFVRYAVHYPFNDSASSFISSDSILNQVWELCKYSIKATSFTGYYVDGDRERIPYEADALINQLAHYCVDSEYAMARRTAEFLFAHPTWPTEWHLQMVLYAWYDYLYTGDKALISKYYKLLKAKTLSALRCENGLISTSNGKLTPEVCHSLNYTGIDPIKDIVDWPRSGSFGIDKKEAGEADGYVLTTYNTVVNAFHYESLVLMARIAKALGHHSEGVQFEKDAESVKSAVNSLLFDKASGCYRDGLDTEHKSLHANMFPLAFGMVPSEYQPSVLEFIHSRGMACSVYGAQYLLDALYEAGDDNYALSLMNSTGLRSWYNMIRVGSTITLEAWDSCFKGNLDWNHAWGAAPADIIPRKLVGVEPLKPGFKVFSVRPQPGTLAYFDAKVPTPHGSVRVVYSADSESEIQKGSLTVTVPRGTRAIVTLPGGDSVIRLRPGKHTLFL